MSSLRWFSLEETPYNVREFSRLWFVALATYGVGDVVTTLTLLFYTDKVDELNVLIRVLAENYGVAGLIGVKLLAFFVCIGICLYGAHEEDWMLFYLPPAVLAVIGGFVTAFNLRLFIG